MKKGNKWIQLTTPIRGILKISGKVIKIHTASRSFDPFNKLIPDALRCARKLSTTTNRLASKIISRCNNNIAGINETSEQRRVAIPFRRQANGDDARSFPLSIFSNGVELRWKNKLSLSARDRPHRFISASMNYRSICGSHIFAVFSSSLHPSPPSPCSLFFRGSLFFFFFFPPLVISRIVGKL